MPTDGKRSGVAGEAGGDGVAKDTADEAVEMEGDFKLALIRHVGEGANVLDDGADTTSRRIVIILHEEHHAPHPRTRADRFEERPELGMECWVDVLFEEKLLNHLDDSGKNRVFQPSVDKGVGPVNQLKQEV
jgi:hypothetical protein